MTEWLFERGHAADIMLAVLLLEAVFLYRAGFGNALRIAAALLPGAFLVLAARAAMTDAGWPLIALFLVLSLPCHLLDLYFRARVAPKTAGD